MTNEPNNTDTDVEPTTWEEDGGAWSPDDESPAADEGPQDPDVGDGQ